MHTYMASNMYTPKHAVLWPGMHACIPLACRACVHTFGRACMRARFGALVWLARACSVERRGWLPPGLPAQLIWRGRRPFHLIRPHSGGDRLWRPCYWVGCVGMFAFVLLSVKAQLWCLYSATFFLISFIETSDITEARRDRTKIELT